MPPTDRSTDALRNPFETGSSGDFETDGQFQEIDTAAGVDRQALDRILGNLRGHLETLIDHRPLDALALSMIVTAAENIRRAARTSDGIRRENHRSGRRRAALERHESVENFRRKLLKQPGNTLAEARMNPDSARCVVELWRCLGESLTTAAGWNDEETALARALTGSAEERVRLTRERLRLDRALADDRQRPGRESAAQVDRSMNGYVDRLIEALERLVPGQRNLHHVVLESVHEKSLELMALATQNGREPAGLDRGAAGSNREGRARWASTRAFVAARVRQWRSFRNRSMFETQMESPAADFESIGIAEMRKADWARKSVSAAIADFQKTLALGKSIGLPDVICPKPVDTTARTAKSRPVPDRPARIDGDETVSRVQSIPARDNLAHSKPNRRPKFPCESAKRDTWPAVRPDHTLETRCTDWAAVRQAGQSLPVAARPKPLRDPFGRFAKASGEPGTASIEPPRRDRFGRFMKASGEAPLADSGCQPERPKTPELRSFGPIHGAVSPTVAKPRPHDSRTLARSLRPSGDLWRLLLSVVPNVTGRGPDRSKPTHTADQPDQQEIGIGEMPSADFADEAGSIALADFDENVQNDGTKPPPEWAGGPDDETNTGQAREGDFAGDDER